MGQEILNGYIGFGDFEKGFFAKENRKYMSCESFYVNRYKNDLKEYQQWWDEHMLYIRVHHVEHIPVESGVMIIVYYRQIRDYPWEAINVDEGQEITQPLESPVPTEKRHKSFFEKLTGS